MEFLGVVAFIIVLSYLSLPGDVNKLNKKVRKIERVVGESIKKEKGEIEMSKIIEELKGKKCTLSRSSDVGITGVVLDVDEEWISIESVNKKGKENQIVRIESIESVVVIEETETI